MKKTMAVGVIVIMLFAAGHGLAQVAVNEWQIPFLNCLTGPLASHGSMYQWSTDQAVADINRAGGIAGKPVKVIGVDTSNDPQKGTVEMARIVKESLVALGPVPEPVIMAAMPIAVENQMLSITGTTSYEYASKFFPWSVAWFPPYPKRFPPLARGWAQQFTDMKKVIQFVEPFGPWPMMADAHVAGLKEAGAEVLKPVEVPSDAVTFGPLVVKALEQNRMESSFAATLKKLPK
jgi:branched-chain amino acid transport system substrate-binding protein